ncbi:MAG: TlpA disulfide reductase family protein [Dehalococcoidales bacterium]
MVSTAAAVLLTIVLLISACTTSSPGETGTRVSEIAPDFRLQSLEGEMVNLGDLRGKVVLLNFWATWCGPCRDEMGYLEEVHREWTDRGLALLAINVGETIPQVEDFMREFNLTLPVLLDGDMGVARIYNITGYPTTFLIDKNGIIQGKQIGAFPNTESIEVGLKKLIQVTP